LHCRVDRLTNEPGSSTVVFPPGTPVFPLIPSWFDGICVDYSHFLSTCESVAVGDPTKVNGLNEVALWWWHS